MGSIFHRLWIDLTAALILGSPFLFAGSVWDIYQMRRREKGNEQ